MMVKSPKQIFTQFYLNNKWGDPQSRSGPGSNLEQSETIRQVLPTLIQELKCNSMLDIPCGDFFWMRLVDFDIQYIGGDIVKELIRENKRKFANKNRKFMYIDLIHNTLPMVDLILCRDGLVHFPNSEIIRALKNIKHSHSSYLLSTTFPEAGKNEDISFGAWRPLNLQLSPFNLPTPMKLINENSLFDNYKDKSLGLWKITDIPDIG